MSQNRHEPYEELISASLHGDLTADERRRLDAHLDTCDQCRGTLAAFAEERRMIAGLRQYSPPRDLGARVRAGIEAASIPWWRRPAAIFTAVGGSLAAVAGALLALVVLNGAPGGPQVGQPSFTPNPGASASAPVSLPEFATPPPSTGATPAPGETPPPEATPTPGQVATSPEPQFAMVVDPAAPADEQAITIVDGTDPEEVVVEPDPPENPPDPTAAIGEPIAAELSSDGALLAFVSREGLSGMNQMLVTRMDDGAPAEGAEPTPTPPTQIAETVSLGESVSGSPFLERLAWSSDSRYLAYTLADPGGAGTDAWVYDAATNETWQLTAVGDAYAASWVDDPDSDAPALWVSRAGGTVTSYLVSVRTGDGSRVEAVDPTTEAIVEAPHVFQPITSPNGALAIYWDGVMSRSGSEWVFSEGGAPLLSEHRPFDGGDTGAFHSARPLFGDLTIDRDAFRSAAISWGSDGDAYAVWQTDWTGLSQAPEGEIYPDPTRVYFGHATEPGGLTRTHALDEDDLPADWSVIDVKVSPTGQHLAVMIAAPLAGQEAPTASLLLVKRNTGDVPDEVETIGEGDGLWYGPAIFDPSETP